MSTIKLFRVTTMIREFRGFKDVAFCWFYNGDRPYHDPERPFPKLIQDYERIPENVRYMAEECIFESFSEDEARQLKAHLDAHYGGAGTTTIEPIELPISADSMALGQIPVGGPQDYWIGLAKGQLPFRPWAYFDLRQASDYYDQQGF